MAKLACSEPGTLFARYSLWLFIGPLVYCSVDFLIRGGPTEGWLIVAVTVLMLLWQWFVCRKFVFVSFDECGVRLKSLWREELVPWDAVQSIGIRRFTRMKPTPYRLTFRRSTIFGSWVLMAMPYKTEYREWVLAEFRSRLKPG